MTTLSQLTEARRYHVAHYGIPARPLREAIDSNYHTLAEELSLAHAGVSMRRPMRVLFEGAHKR